MQKTLESFVRALRASDIRVSPAETIDAHRAAEAVGYADRELFRDALVTTLAKTASETARFDELFDTFFSRDEFLQPPADAEDRARRGVGLAGARGRALDVVEDSAVA